MMHILHLSDLHFGRLLPNQVKTDGSKSAHHFVDKDTDNPNPHALADILKRDLDAQVPDVVIVSGDIGWSGAPDDYQYARTFLDSLSASWSHCPIVLCPGNHDVDFKLSSNRQEHYISFVRSYYKGHFKSQYPLLNIPDTDPKSASLFVGFHNLTFSRQSGEVEHLLVVAVNSAAHMGDDGTPIYIPPEVLDKVARQVKKLKCPSDIVDP